MKLVFLALYLAVPTLVFGHGWLVSPQPRGFAGDNQNSASTTGLCGVEGTWDTAFNVSNFDKISLTYDIGGGHDNGNGPGMCYFSLAANINNQTEFNENTFFTVPCTATGGAVTKNATLYYLPLGTETANLYLQFVWKSKQGSVWYNCAMVNVIPSEIVMSELKVGKTVSNTIAASEVDYYKATLAANEFLYIKAKAPASGGLTIALKGNTLPTGNDYDSKFTVSAGNTVAATTCSSGTDEETGFISVTAGSKTSGTYTLETSSYNGYVDYAYIAYPQISTSSSGAETKFYSALAYTTVDVPKRIIVEGDAKIGLAQSLTCETLKVQSSGDSGACVDLSSSTATKYIQVTTYGKTAYTVGIEDGTCATWSSAKSVAASTLLIVSAIIFLLF